MRPFELALETLARHFPPVCGHTTLAPYHTIVQTLKPGEPDHDPAEAIMANSIQVRPKNFCFGGSLAVSLSRCRWRHNHRHNRQRQSSSLTWTEPTVTIPCLCFLMQMTTTPACACTSSALLLCQARLILGPANLRPG